MRFPTELAIFLAMAGMLLSPAGSHRAMQDAQKRDPHAPSNRPAVVMSMTAKDFAFNPSVIHMKVNEKLEVDVTAIGQPVGIHISPFPDGAKANTPPGLSFLFGEDCYKVKKDEMVPILIEATEPGTYSFTCCKNCGSNHKTMRGQIIVDPQS